MQANPLRIKIVQQLWDTSYYAIEGKILQRLNGLARCCSDACHRTHRRKYKTLRTFRQGN